MGVSSRFRDIFGSRAVEVRRTDRVSEAGSDHAAAQVATRRRTEIDIEAIWLDIAIAHRRAALAFTPPPSTKASGLSQD
jgi:hypothetical protein